jgi:hypothetical protein
MKIVFAAWNSDHFDVENKVFEANDTFCHLKFVIFNSLRIVSECLKGFHKSFLIRNDWHLRYFQDVVVNLDMSRRWLPSSASAAATSVSTTPIPMLYSIILFPALLTKFSYYFPSATAAYAYDKQHRCWTLSPYPVAHTLNRVFVFDELKRGKFGRLSLSNIKINIDSLGVTKGHLCPSVHLEPIHERISGDGSIVKLSNRIFGTLLGHNCLVYDERDFFVVV